MTNPIPQNALIQSDEVSLSHVKRLFILAFLLAGTIAAAAVAARYWLGEPLQPALGAIGIALAAFVSLLLSRRDNILLPTLLMVVALWAGNYYSMTQIPDLGIFLAVSGFVIALVLIAETLPKYISLAVILNALLAIGLVLSDVFWTGEREPFLPNNSYIVPGLLMMGVVLFGGIIARQMPRYSLRAKLFAINIMVVVSAVIGLTFFIGQSTSAALTASIGGNLSSMADIQAINVGNTLAQQINQMQAFAFNQAFEEGLTAVNNSYEGDDQEAIAQLQQLNQAWQEAEYTDPIIQDRLSTGMAAELLTFRNTFRNYSEVFITDQYGAVAASTFRNEKLYYGDEAWWRTVRRGGIHISDPIVNPNSRLIYINLAIPIFVGNSFDVLGSMNVTYSLRDLRNVQLTAENDLGATGRIELLLPSNQLIRMSTYSSEMLADDTRQKLDETQSQYIILTSGRDEELTSQAGVYTSANLSDIRSLNWRVITRQGLQASLEPVANQQRQLTILGLIVMVLSTLAVVFFGRVLVRPILELTNTAQQFSQGNLDARVAISSSDELGLLANTFNNMAGEMKASLLNLEQRVADRTQALETSIEVSRGISNILDPQELTRQVVHSVQSAFDYYHVHIYLADAQNEYLLLSGGTGEAGIAMMSAQHKIVRGKGLVGRAAELNDVVLVTDVAQDPQWMANPLLPETRAEAAVPIAIGDHVFGVLDVQHNVRGGLTNDDVILLQSIAGQVAIALQNARLYQQAQSQAQRNLLINEINQKIQRSVTIDQVLQVAAEELAKAVDARRATVQLQQQRLQVEE